LTLFFNSYSIGIKYDIIKMKKYVYKGIKNDINL
jgi:hypothetical protein